MSAADHSHERLLRKTLARLVEWEDAHVSFDGAVEALPPAHYGSRPEGLPYSPWQLVEHVRLTQRDILDFCTNPEYVEPEWPDDYWPEGAAPPNPEAWAESLASYRTDRAALIGLIRNEEIGLFDQIPHGEGQTYLREILLVADHTAYHVAQLVAVRRLLGVWR